MSVHHLRGIAVAAACALLAGAAGAAGVSVRAATTDITGAPFPSNRYTVFDPTQNTLRRVSLPKPDCAVRVSDCQDIDVINTLDGFSTQPRITVPFSGDIDVSTVTSDTMYLLSLGDPISHAFAGERVGINQVIFDSATKTLAVESDQLLREHVRYVLVVTNGIKDAAGNPIGAGDWRDAATGLALGRDAEGPYRAELRDALRAMPLAARQRVVASTVFTTQSSTTELTKINAVIKASRPAAVNFLIGQQGGGAVRALFDVAALSGIQFNRQTGTAPSFTPSALPLAALSLFPNSIAKIAYGRFASPDYETPQKYIPPTRTLLQRPQPQGTNDLVVQVFLPTGTKPANGWPVAIFGHGFGDSMYGAPWLVASTLASRGIASININVVGHGGGALGTLSVQRASGGDPVVVPAGGRGIDQDGNGAIDSTEGSSAAPPRAAISSRDGLRQTVIDLMQLTRLIELGVDIDGDSVADLDPNRIYYSGQSFGGIYGTILLGSEPSLKAGVPNVGGGSITEIARLGGFRVLTAIALATRVPQLLNLPPAAGVPFPANLRFDENIPLRNLPPVVNTVPGAFEIAKTLDRLEWVQQAGNPVSYAPLVKQRGVPIIFQFAKGDQTVPNPTSTAIVRAGDFADRVTYFRYDLAYAANPALPKNPHTFVANILNPGVAPYAVAAQTQIAVFFQSNGTTTIDPDGAGPFFETPIAGPLPEALNYIP